jgi:hypothetical protein
MGDTLIAHPKRAPTAQVGQTSLLSSSSSSFAAHLHVATLHRHMNNQVIGVKRWRTTKEESTRGEWVALLKSKQLYLGPNIRGGVIFYYFISFSTYYTRSLYVKMSRILEEGAHSPSWPNEIIIIIIIISSSHSPEKNNNREGSG